MCTYTHTHTHTHTCHEVILTFKARKKRKVQKRRGYTAVYAPEWKSYVYYLCKSDTRRKILIVAPFKTNLHVNFAKKTMFLFSIISLPLCFNAKTL